MIFIKYYLNNNNCSFGKIFIFINYFVLSWLYIVSIELTAFPIFVPWIFMCMNPCYFWLYLTRLLLCNWNVMSCSCLQFAEWTPNEQSKWKASLIKFLGSRVYTWINTLMTCDKRFIMTEIHRWVLELVHFGDDFIDIIDLLAESQTFIEHSAD